MFKFNLVEALHDTTAQNGNRTLNKAQEFKVFLKQGSTLTSLALKLERLYGGHNFL
jgi:hypothetical protein